MDSNVVSLECGNDTVTIHLFGATVTSWVCNGDERLFLSSITKTDGSKAIRGGIPIVFPNFGPWSQGPQHGFARISWWNIEDTKKLDDGSTQAILTLEDDEKTRSMWDFKFKLCYTVTLSSKTLKTSLTVINKDCKFFDFTVLFHSYFRISQINSCLIGGFKGCKYDDKVTKQADAIENRELIAVTENVDRVYESAGAAGHVIVCGDNKIEIQKENLPDTVLWNPWSSKAKEMSDFDDDGYLHMVCVEAGHVKTRFQLQAGEQFTFSQLLNVLS